MKASKSTLGLIGLIAMMVIAMFLLPEPNGTNASEASLASNEASDATSDAISETASYAGLALINARVFDGESVHENATLLIRDGLVERLQVDGEIPIGYEQIDIDGQTLLPGLIDAHVHSYNSARVDALRFGVTTMLDMFRPPFDLGAVQAQRESVEATDQADLFTAGFLATAEGGHGTQYGIAVPTLAGPDEADAWVEARLSEGSDYIKIVIESGAAWGGQMPTLDSETVTALVAAAHARRAMAVAHVSTQAGARMAVDAGVDGLVHLFADEPLDPALATRLATDNIFVIPTMTVLAGSHGQSGQGWIESTDAMAERLSTEQGQSLAQSFPGSALRAARWPIVPASVRALHEAGVEILAGSDAPNPATAHGASLLHELKLLNEAGLTPIETLRTATSIPAARFNLPGRGCLQAGCRADVVWIAGDPLTQIDDLRHIQGVWKNGARVELETDAMTDVDINLASDASSLPEAMDLPLDMHSNGQWLPSTDEFMGGKSTVDFGIDDESQMVTINAQLNSGFPFPYAGVMWNPGEEIMAAVNLGEAERLSLVLEAEQGSFQAMLFSGENAMAPPIRVDVLPGQTTTIDLKDYNGLDLSRFRAIGIYAIGGEQAVEFSVQGAVLQ